MKVASKILTLAVATIFLASCAKDLDSTTYVNSSTTGIVYEGVILSSRVVKVKDSDQLGKKPGLGTLAGGVGGGVAGSELGKGKGSTAGAVGGVVAGAVLGAIIEDQLSTGQGIEYVIKLSQESVDENAQATSKRTYKVGGDTVAEKLRDSTVTGLKSRIISVVQGVENQIPVGQKVYIIYSDDRPRVIPAV